MSDSHDTQRADRLREALASVADQIPLETESSGESRMQTFGAAFAMASKMVSVSPGQVEAAVKQGDPIEDLVGRWEGLSPQEMESSWRDYATDPYVGFGEGWVGKVDQAAIDHWIGSSELKKALADYPIYSPRKVKIENLQVVHLGADRAAATYRVEEEHTNGKVTAGNAVAVLMLDGGSWKIVAASKGGRNASEVKA